MSKSHKYIKKQNINGTVKYIYKESDLRSTRALDKSILEAKQVGGRYAGPNYEKATRFFIDRTSSSRSKTTSDEDQTRENGVAEFIDYCKSNRLWKESMPEISSKNYLDKGAETNVFLSGNSKVLKQMTLSQHEHLQSPIEDILERIALYNSIFPETALKLEGFGQFDFEGNKEFSVLVTQPRIENMTRVLRDEARRFMESKGFKYDKGNTYYNSHFIIDDLHADNIVKTKSGDYFIIDCFIEQNNETGWNKIEGE